jgi:hypothetical protein
MDILGYGYFYHSGLRPVAEVKQTSFVTPALYGANFKWTLREETASIPHFFKM